MRIIITLFFFVISQLGLTQTQTEKYIETIKDIAISQSASFGVPVSIIMSQAIIESQSGQSKLARLANNHFGIKCGSGWEGKSFTKDDDKPAECFRKYSSLKESFEDHSRILTNRDRYKFLFSYKKTDYKSWAHGLKKAGYATNPKYAQVLIKYIERYKLYKYDSEN